MMMWIFLSTLAFAQTETPVAAAPVVAEAEPTVAAEPAVAEVVPAAPAYVPPPIPSVDEVPPGSLWSESNARVLIGQDGNARLVGDLITVNIIDDTQAESTASTDTFHDSESTGRIGSLFGLETSIPGANPDMGGKIELSVSGGSSYAGKGSTVRQGTLQGTLTCTVVEVLANHNLVIEGHKVVQANREPQVLSLRGTVRPRDIKADNTVESTLLADAVIAYSGQGVVSDQQGPGVAHRILDRAWPF